MTGVQLFGLEGGVAERPIALGETTEWPIRLRTHEVLTPDLLAPFKDVEVRSVWLMGSRHTDRDVALAARTFPTLQQVHVPHGNALTDECVRALISVGEDFRGFTAYRTKITDEGAKILATFPEIRDIRLNQGLITDIGVEAFGACRALAILMLDGNFRIQGRGLAAFEDHRALRVLSLEGTKVNDDAVGNLAGCAELERVHLSSTNVSERCVLTLPLNPGLHVFLPRGLDQERIDEVRADCPNLIVNGLYPEHIIDIPRALDGTPVQLPAELRGNSLTFAMFTSPHCGPCGWLKSTYDLVRPSLREQFKFVELDVDDHLALASALRIRSVPTVFIMRFGIELQRFTGAVRVEKLTEYLEAALDA